jgi:hypothetical protein
LRRHYYTCFRRWLYLWWRFTSGFRRADRRRTGPIKIVEVKDLSLLIKVTEELRDFVPIQDLELWITLPKCHMFVEEGTENVGIATFEYPGVYSVHWYMKNRGRHAIDLAKAMIKNLFENYDAKVIRGVIRQNLKASRWAARQVGMKSLGMIEYKDGLNELFVTTKEEFLKENVNG